MLISFHWSLESFEEQGCLVQHAFQSEATKIENNNKGLRQQHNYRSGNVMAKIVYTQSREAPERTI